MSVLSCLVYLFRFLFIYRSMYFSLSLYIYIYISISIYIYISLYIYIYIYICIYTSLSLYLSLSLSVAHMRPRGARAKGGGTQMANFTSQDFGIFPRGLGTDSSSPQTSAILVGHFTWRKDSLEGFWLLDAWLDRA